MQAQDLVISKNEIFHYIPRSLDELEKISSKIANSGLCPTALRGRPDDVLMILITGAELGLKIGQSLRTLGAFNGIVFAYGDGLTALVQRHKEFRGMQEHMEGKIEDGSAVYFCTMIRGDQEPVTRSYSMAEAKRAGLLGKAGPWVLHTKRMLARRARSYTAKDTFADALFGLLSEDEVMNIPTNVIEMPKQTTSKGIDALKQKLGVAPEPEVVAEAEYVDVVEETPIMELHRLIAETNTSQKKIDSWLKAANVTTLEEMEADKIEKCINHLKKD